MLDNNIINKIEEFVYVKPRTIQEIANLINKNWRTADRYVSEIQKNLGTISTRVFREGTRGALKIVYWSAIERASSSVLQKRIEEDILRSKRKEDFSAFDIFQYVPEKNRKSFIYDKEEEQMNDFIELLLNTKKQLLIFSGNLSFINLKNKKKDILFVFEQLIDKRVSIKILSRVDLAGKDNIERVLSLNYKKGMDFIEIHHEVQPLRGVIIDKKFIRLKEVKEPTGKIRELNKRKFIFYNINDKSWAEWLSRIFWNKFHNSIDANKRLKHLNQILKRKFLI